MWLNNPSWIEEEKISIITLEDEKLRSPEWCLEETKDIITLIQKEYKNRSLHLLVFKVHEQKIRAREWRQHWFIQDKYHIPLLFIKIHEILTPEEQENFKNAFTQYSDMRIWIWPESDIESIIRGIKFYQNHPS